MVEARKYEAFPKRGDEGRLQAFLAASWRERAELVGTFKDDRLPELGRLIVFPEHPEVLRPELRQGLETWLHNRLHGRDGLESGPTIGDLLAEIEKLAGDGGDQNELNEIRDRLDSHSPENHGLRKRIHK